MNQETALPVYRGLLTKVVRSVKELSARRIHRGQQRKPLFDRFPFRQWVNSNALTCQARDIKILAVLLLNESPELRSNLQTPLHINSRRVVSSQHSFGPDERALVGGPKEKRY